MVLCFWVWNTQQVCRTSSCPRVPIYQPNYHTARRLRSATRKRDNLPRARIMNKFKAQVRFRCFLVHGLCCLVHRCNRANEQKQPLARTPRAKRSCVVPMKCPAGWLLVTANGHDPNHKSTHSVHSRGQEDTWVNSTWPEIKFRETALLRPFLDSKS